MKRSMRISLERDRDRRGFVLIVVMVIVTLVSFAGFAFVHTMTNEYRAVHANGDLLAAEQALASAELMLCSMLEDSGDEISNSGGWDDHSRQFQEQLLLPARREERRQSDPLAWRFSIVTPARHDKPQAEETADVRFGLANESARLNVSALLTFDAVVPGNSRRALMGLPGMSETAADSILDWLDADDHPREFGAEADQYLEWANPFQPRNAIPRTLQELLLVPGVSRARLFGPDTNRNFVIDTHEQRFDGLVTTTGRDGFDPESELHGWADYLTLHSGERNVDRSGRPRVNLNQPDAGRLRRELSEFFPVDAVDFVLAYRQFGPEDDVGPVSQTGSDSGGSHESVRFPLASVADLIDARVTSTDGEASRLVHSPLTSSSRETLDLLFDRTTTDSRVVIPGRINVNRAPRRVLEAIPGLSPDVAARILARRAALDEQALQTPAWLLTEQILSVDELRNLLPFVTTGGDVYRAQIVVWRPRGGPYRRTEVLIDATRRPVVRIVRTDLSAFGVGFPISRLSASIGDGELWAKTSRDDVSQTTRGWRGQTNGTALALTHVRPWKHQFALGDHDR